jgi:hypothetical protein
VIDPMQAFLEAASLRQPNFPASSRYHGIGTAVHVTPDGRSIAYVLRRIVPPADRFATLEEYQVVEGDRIDNVASRFLGDPEQYWRLADANGALRPDELTREPGRFVRITLPEGVPAPSDD